MCDIDNTWIKEADCPKPNTTMPKIVNFSPERLLRSIVTIFIPRFCSSKLRKCLRFIKYSIYKSICDCFYYSKTLAAILPIHPVLFQREYFHRYNIISMFLKYL